MFFSNSGAEAIEGGIKLVRKYQYVNGRPQRYKIICFDQAFHGRTGAALAATGNEKYLQGFGPKAPGFVHVPLNNTNVVRDAIDDETAAILVEPVQGEGGVRSGTGEFLRSLRQICDEYGLLLFFDEIQCGFGRTGRLWAHEWFDVFPDVMAVAKGIGNGFPLGAFLATEKAAAGMVFGTHGSTYGGNPLATAVGNAVLDVMLAPGFFEGVRERAGYFRPRLEALVARSPGILAEVRGTGFILGLRCVVPSADVVNALFERNMLTVGAGDNVVRIYPSLVAPKEDLDHGLGIIEDACKSLMAKLATAAPAGTGDD
jgi:acetylornithine/N-succinyldiaminopimelate aminotransferase